MFNSDPDFARYMADITAEALQGQGDITLLK
jgi:hypothetical protein